MSNLSSLEKRAWESLVRKNVDRRTSSRILKKIAIISPERASALVKLAKAR